MAGYDSLPPQHRHPTLPGLFHPQRGIEEVKELVTAAGEPDRGEAWYVLSGP